MAVAHPGIIHHQSFLETNTPDIDVDRDSAIIGGVLSDDSVQLRFNLSTMILSAIIFLAILAWFDFMQTTFYTWLQPQTQETEPTPASKLYYAILSTVVVAILSGLILIYRKNLQI